MKTIYLFTAFVFLASCQSDKTPPEKHTKEQVTETNHNKNFSVQLGNDLMGRGLEGAYLVYSDSAQQHFGHSTPTIKSVTPTEFATLITSIKPEKCIGKRVEYTAWVKAKDVQGWAGLWLRIDPDNPKQNASLGFDNMYRRPIKGTQDWIRYHIVLDVPEGATNLVYGALLDGNGQIWVDSMNIKIVDKSVATTDNIARKTL